MSNHLDPLDLASQDRAHAEADERSRMATQIEINDLKWLMGDIRGRRFMSRLLAQAGIYRLSFSAEPLVMAFNEGARNGGLKLLAQLTTHCLERYTNMLSENQE